MYVFHEDFNIRFWDIDTSEFLDEVFVYGSSDPNCDGDEGVYFPSIILYGVI